MPHTAGRSPGAEISEWLRLGTYRRIGGERGRDAIDAAVAVELGGRCGVALSLAGLEQIPRIGEFGWKHLH